MSCDIFEVGKIFQTILGNAFLGRFLAGIGFGIKNLTNERCIIFYFWGSSGGSLVATPDCKLQSWVQIQQSPQPTVDCQSLDGLPSGMALCCMLSSEGRQRSICKKHQKQLRKKKLFSTSRNKSCMVGKLRISCWFKKQACLCESKLPQKVKIKHFKIFGSILSKNQIFIFEFFYLWKHRFWKNRLEIKKIH
jgi:hypothetical protein